MLKIDFQEKIEEVVVKVIFAVAFALLAFIVGIFLSILAAVLINHWLKSDYLGFLLVFLFYGIILAIFILAKDSVSHQIKRIAENITDNQLNKP